MLILAHDAVDAPPPTRSREELGLPSGKLVVYAGSRGPGKGIETIEAALPHLKEKGVQMHLIAGKTPREARQALAVADVVLVPNSAQNEQYGVHSSPMKLFEALASGARVVASDAPAITQVVTDKEVWFFKADDPDDLVHAVIEAFDDSHAQDRVVRAQELAQRYSWDERARIILDGL